MSAPEVRHLLADVRRATADARATAEAVRVEREELARQSAGRDEERARAARRGDLGPDWQEVQHRIDAGRTTLADVLGGADRSPAAVRLQETAAERLVEVQADVRSAAQDPRSDVAAAFAELDEVARRIHDLRRRLAGEL